VKVGIQTPPTTLPGALSPRRIPVADNYLPSAHTVHSRSGKRVQAKVERGSRSSASGESLPALCWPRSSGMCPVRSTLKPATRPL
jgi:hypothetical protein